MQTLICDSCEGPITDMNNYVQVLIYTPELIADPRLDLCPACADDVVKSKKVQRGQTKAKDKIKKWTPAIEPINPTGEPIDDYEPQVGDGPASREELRGDVTPDEVPT